LVASTSFMKPDISANQRRPAASNDPATGSRTSGSLATSSIVNPGGSCIVANASAGERTIAGGTTTLSGSGVCVSPGAVPVLGWDCEAKSQTNDRSCGPHPR
jgi:hypothetical protein